MKALMIALLLVLSIAGAAQNAQAACSGLADSFWGDLDINGNPAPIGTDVRAMLSGEVRGEYTTTQTGVYGNQFGDDKLYVPGNTDGSDFFETITFEVFIGGEWVDSGESSPYQCGFIKNLDVDAVGAVDDDGDGFNSDVDCDDSDAQVNPGATEVADGVDNDCDGLIDEGTSVFDDDGDGFSEDDGDCDDANDTVFPGAPELEDGLDNDCDGLVDEGTSAFDDDGDGFTENAGDCDDADDTVFPGATELEDGVDNDCDGTVDEGTNAFDDDADGFTENAGDCDDGDAGVNPAATEVCNGADDNCDGNVDETGDALCDDSLFCNGAEVCGGFSGCLAGSAVDCSANDFPAVDMCVADPDNNDLTHDQADGFASVCDEDTDSCTEDVQEFTHECSIDMCGAECESDLDCAVTDCSAFDGCIDGVFRDFSNAGGTCNEACGCDAGLCTDFVEVSTDLDGDGFNVECALDCNDDDDTVFPGADELADGKDNDCDGTVDEGTTSFDDDGDGFTEDEGDCDDANAAVHPGAEEVQDGVDNDCDGEVDEVDVLPDEDDDGFTSDVDCNDADASIHPGAVEVCNGVDDNCDGNVDETGDALCDDGLFCNGEEICAGVSGCQDGGAVDCSANDLPEVDMCVADPDNNDMTHDTAAGFTSVCDEESDSCTEEEQVFTHECSIDMCGAECESDLDCSATDCTSFDGCVDGKFREFSAAAGTCNDACGCDAGVCSDFVEFSTDLDGDGFNVECDLDCNDNDAAVNPDATEICDNGVDDNCNGLIDDADAVCDQVCVDTDGDGVCDIDDQCVGHDDLADADEDGTADGCDICPNDALDDADGDGVCGDVDLCEGHDDKIDFDNDGIPFGCDDDTVIVRQTNITIYEGWSLFALPYDPIGVDNSEELGQAIISSGDISCDLMMRYNGESQMMEDDLLGLPDPAFPLAGTEGYFIHCDGPATYTYDGTLWE